ncbi:MAG: hypothetical protein AB3X41_07605 [Leptothrix ochracea]|uniref:hypothetical protein n=1 Tax=Leptothrix ochracea TaxID=735331 RepID=UPI0034E2505E
MNKLLIVWVLAMGLPWLAACGGGSSGGSSSGGGTTNTSTVKGVGMPGSVSVVTATTH